MKKFTHILLKIKLKFISVLVGIRKTNLFRSGIDTGEIFHIL